MSITHAKVSAKADGADTTLVRPSDWNAKHVSAALFDVTTYGAKGDGVTNDNVAVAAAVAAVPDGCTLYFPSGTYVLTATIAFTGKSVTIKGDGPDKTILKFTGCHGITITLTDDDNSADVRDMSLVTNSAGTYIALTVTGYDSASSTYPHLFASNLWIHSFADATTYWSQGIKLVEVWNGKISHCIIRGSNSYTNMDSGIYITNQSIDNHLIDVTVYHANYGVSVADVTPNPEGVHLVDCTFVAVGRGVSWAAPTNGGLDLQVIGGHINAYDYGIFAQNVPQSMVVGTLIYKAETSTAAFVGVYFETSDNVRVSDVCIRGAGTSGGGNGVVLGTGCDYCTIANMSVNDQTTGIWLQSGCTNAAVVAGNGYDTTTDILNDGGVTNAIINLIDGIVAIPGRFHQGGAAFPTSHATGDQFFRTDLGWWCYYDGTRWLTCAEFVDTPGVYDTAVSGDSTVAYRQMRSDYAPYFTRCCISVYVAATNDGSKYWTVNVTTRTNVGGVGNTIYSFTTAADTEATWTNHDGAPSTANPATYGQMALNAAKTSTPGNLNFKNTNYYRLIVT